MPLYFSAENSFYQEEAIKDMFKLCKGPVGVARRSAKLWVLQRPQPWCANCLSPSDATSDGRSRREAKGWNNTISGIPEEGAKHEVFSGEVTDVKHHYHLPSEPVVTMKVKVFPLSRITTGTIPCTHPHPPQVTT